MIAQNRRLDISAVPSSELDVRSIERYARFPFGVLSTYAVVSLGLESNTVSEILRAVGGDVLMPREEITLPQFYETARRLMEANARRQSEYDN